MRLPAATSRMLLLLQLVGGGKGEFHSKQKATLSFFKIKHYYILKNK